MVVNKTTVTGANNVLLVGSKAVADMTKMELRKYQELQFMVRFGDSPEYARRRRIVIRWLQRADKRRRATVLNRLNRLADVMIQVGKGGK